MVCRYEKEASYTLPGTEMNVTPDSESLIMPMATRYQTEFLLPMKYDCASAFRVVRYEMSNSRKK